MLNRFQKWADDYARAHGWQVTPHANWVILAKDGESHECMSAAGVQARCQTMTTKEERESRAAHGVALCDPSRPLFP